MASTTRTLSLSAAKNVAYSGATGRTTSSDSHMLTLAAGSTATIRAKLHLPRSAVTNKGLHLMRVGLTYKFASGTLTSLTPTLVKHTHSDAATAATTSITLATASPAFDLTSPAATQSSRGMNAIAAASADDAIADEANTVSTDFLWSATLVADTATVVEIISVEVEYMDDTYLPTASSIKTTDYGLAAADSGLELQADISSEDVSFTLPAAANATDGCVFTIKVVKVDTAGTNVINVVPDAGDAIVGLGLTLDDGDQLQIDGPVVGDYVKVSLVMNGGAPVVRVLEAAGAWVDGGAP